MPCFDIINTVIITFLKGSTFFSIVISISFISLNDIIIIIVIIITSVITIFIAIIAVFVDNSFFCIFIRTSNMHHITVTLIFVLFYYRHFVIIHLFYGLVIFIFILELSIMFNFLIIFLLFFSFTTILSPFFCQVVHVRSRLNSKQTKQPLIRSWTILAVWTVCFMMLAVKKRDTDFLFANKHIMWFTVFGNQVLCHTVSTCRCNTCQGHSQPFFPFKPTSYRSPCGGEGTKVSHKKTDL